MTMDVSARANAGKGVGLVHVLQLSTQRARDQGGAGDVQQGVQHVGTTKDVRLAFDAAMPMPTSGQSVAHVHSMRNVEL